MLPDVRTDTVCKLAEIAVVSVVKPSNVLKLVPKASTVEIAEFLRVAEENNLRERVLLT